MKYWLKINNETHWPQAKAPLERNIVPYNLPLDLAYLVWLDGDIPAKSD